MRSIYKCIELEMDRIDLLEDEREKAVRWNLLDAIVDSVNEYSKHLLSFEYQKELLKMKEKGVEFIPVKYKESITAKWNDLFASKIDKGDKKRFFYDQYRLNLFSNNVLHSLEKSKARQAFNQCKKSDVYVFHQWKDEAYQIVNAGELTSADFDKEKEVYIFDAVEKWTYVHTHDVECGPFFYCVE